MNTNVDVICYRPKVLSNGEHPLMIRLTKEGKRKYVSLHLSINPEYWDFNKNQPKRNCPNKEKIKKLIDNKLQEFRDEVLNFKTNQKDYTINTLINKVSTPIQKKTFGAYISDYLYSLHEKNRLGYAKIYHELANSVLAYYKTTDFLFSDIDNLWLEKYEQWQRGKGNKDNTISIRFRALRALYNQAITDNIIRSNDSPFEKFKLSKLCKETPKRSISKDDIFKIINLNLEQVNDIISPYLEFSKDIFIFSYLSCGINLTDIAKLKRENIINNTVCYKRQKTGRKISFTLHPLAAQIIEKYNHITSKAFSSPSQFRNAVPNKDSGYLFPILNNNIHKTEMQKKARITKVNKKINKALHIIGNHLELPISLTTYVARHTFATVLKRSGVNISLISESLGHSDIKTTQIYLDSFENAQIDAAMSNLL